jgi:NADH-quinone oxidoreductase subunit J
MILLVAMIGAIVLTLQHKARVRRQNIAEQVARTPAMSMEVVKVRQGQGLGSNTLGSNAIATTASTTSAGGNP